MAAARDLKLLGSWVSPFVHRVQIALHLKSVVDYQFIEENLLESKSELLLKSNPVYKKIPVLFHGDKTICESLVIVEYIDEVCSSGPSILPSNPYDRAVARFWAAYVDNKWFAALKGVLSAEGEEALKAAMAQVEEGLELLEEAFGKLSKGKAFFGGDEIGILDLAFGSFLVWIQVIENYNGMKMISEAKTPCLLKWAHSFSSHVAVKDVLPDAEKLAEFGFKLRAKILEAGASSN